MNTETSFIIPIKPPVTLRDREFGGREVGVAKTSEQPPASHPATDPASHAASQPVSQPASQPFGFQRLAFGFRISFSDFDFQNSAFSLRLSVLGFRIYDFGF